MVALRQCRALVLDHEPCWTPLFTAMLSKLGWYCEVVTSSERALTQLLSEKFDIFITDYDSPTENGFHFICRLREQSIMLPVIVASSDSRVLDLLSRNVLSVCGVLLKPFTVADLETALKAASARSQT